MKKNYLNRFSRLSEKDKKLFFSVCEQVVYPAGSYIDCMDTTGNRYFFIIMDGMVREFQMQDEVEHTLAFYCENDFFGFYSRRPLNKQIRFQAMESVVLFRIQNDHWEIVQSLSPPIKMIWCSLLEKQIMSGVSWNDAFSAMRAADWFQLLLRQKPALGKKARLHSVITALSNN